MFSWLVFDEKLKPQNKKEMSARLIQYYVRRWLEFTRRQHSQNKLKEVHEELHEYHRENTSSSEYSSEEEGEESTDDNSSSSDDETCDEQPLCKINKSVFIEESIWTSGTTVCIMYKDEYKKENPGKQNIFLGTVQSSCNQYVSIQYNETEKQFKVKRVLEETDKKVRTLCETNDEFEWVAYIETFVPVIPENYGTLAIGSHVCITYDEEYRKQHPEEDYDFIGRVCDSIVDSDKNCVYNIDLGIHGTFTYSNKVYISSLERNLFVDNDNWVVQILPIQLDSYQNKLKFTSTMIEPQPMNYFPSFLVPGWFLFIMIVPYFFQKTI